MHPSEVTDMTIQREDRIPVTPHPHVASRPEAPRSLGRDRLVEAGAKA